MPNNCTEKQNIIKLIPHHQSYLWGGTRLAALYAERQENLPETIAESWVLWNSSQGSNLIEGGGCLRDYLAAEYPDADRFELLVKLIDAAQPLSVQVHPDDGMAQRYGMPNGKTECWYVVDCAPGAFLYMGFRRQTSAEEVRTALERGEIESLLNRIEVKKGDCFYIPAGTVHAIGAGIFIAEVQQNSNTTYRVYDYNRRDAQGNLRELHIDRALEAMNFSAYRQKSVDDLADGMLCDETYFAMQRLVSKEETLTIPTKEVWQSLLIVDGAGRINGTPCITGDSFYIPAGEQICLRGDCTAILSWPKPQQ